MKSQDFSELVADAVLIALFSLAAVTARDFLELARFPYYISIGGLGILAIKTVADVLGAVRRRGTSVDAAGTESGPPVLTTLYYLAWFLGYIGLVALVGIVWGSVVFIAGFLTLETKASWLMTGISVVAVYVALYGISSALNLFWPANLAGL